MGWADAYIEKLARGEVVRFRPHGHSMTGKIESGQLCTVEPVHGEIVVGDVVLCRVHGSQYLHLVKAIQPLGPRFLIGNNRGGTNGWITSRQIFGRLLTVE